MLEELIYGVHARFWMQPNIVTFIWTGLGLSYIVYIIHCTKLPQMLQQFLFIVIPILATFTQIYTNYHQLDQSSN